jgi:phosphonopyruvate decarboxylase
VDEMLTSEEILRRIVENNYTYWSGVPCSLLGDFITLTSHSNRLSYFSASNEGESVAINAGLFLGNKRAISIFQNSGLGNAINPITSLMAINKIKVPLIISLRGDHLGYKDEPQHKVMGEITEEMLSKIGFLNHVLSGAGTDNDVFEIFLKSLNSESCLTSLLIHRGSIKQDKRNADQIPHVLNKKTPSDIIDFKIVENSKYYKPELYRRELISILCDYLDPRDIVVSTTGFTSRELSAISDRDRNFYMVGAMGCASAVALGLAIARPQNRVFVLDGDGANLMRMGTLTTIGKIKPKNLVHILLNNNSHESTGNQALSSISNLSFSAISKICGYSTSLKLSSKSEVKTFFTSKLPNELTFVQISIVPGSMENLPRPIQTPEENTLRIKSSLNGKE